jgi:glycine hydroxymethyltransferase
MLLLRKRWRLKKRFQKNSSYIRKMWFNNAKVLAQQLMAEGIDLVSKGTDNHMVLADLTHFNITGKDAQDVLGQGRYYGQ